MKVKQIVFTKPCVAELLEKEMEAPKAVSYTHLDVYKRQCISSASWKAGRVFSGAYALAPRWA